MKNFRVNLFLCHIKVLNFFSFIYRVANGFLEYFLFALIHLRGIVIAASKLGSCRAFEKSLELVTAPIKTKFMSTTASLKVLKRMESEEDESKTKFCDVIRNAKLLNLQKIA